jgi:hypothetical protein
MALYIEESDGIPYASSIVLVESPSRRFTRSPSRDSEMGLRITVRAPVILYFPKTPSRLLIKTGQIVKHASISQNHLVMSWLNEASLSICNDLRVNVEQRAYCAQHYSLEPLIRAVLRGIIEQGHGGMIVILPNDGTDIVKIGYPTQSQELRNALMRHWESLYETRCVVEEGRKYQRII